MTIEPGQIVSFPTSSLYGHMKSTYYTCFVNQSLMKIEMKINEITSKVLLKVKSQLSYPPWIWEEYWKIIERFCRNFHNGLHGSLPVFAVDAVKFWTPITSDIRALANRADPDQNAPEEHSDQGLPCLPFW